MRNPRPRLESLLKDISPEIGGYAAEAALKYLIQHWEQTILEGHPPKIITTDINNTIKELQRVLHKSVLISKEINQETTTP